MEFTALQAARLTACSISQLRYWARVGLVRASSGRRYAFRDLVALRMVRSLLDAGLPLQRIRKAVEYLQTLPEPAGAGGSGWTHLRLVSDGATVYACHDDGEVLDALRQGQLALFVSVEAVVQEVEAEVRQFANERDAFVDSLHADRSNADG